MAVSVLFNSTQVANRIKEYAKSKGIVVKDVLEKSSLARTALGNMRTGSMPKADNLARIAEQLDCSVDYLLGRTDNPSIPGSTLSEEQQRILRAYYKADEGTRNSINKLLDL